jgi:hypothetical protein
MDRTSGQPQVKLSLLRSISLKIRPEGSVPYLVHRMKKNRGSLVILVLPTSELCDRQITCIASCSTKTKEFFLDPQKMLDNGVGGGGGQPQVQEGVIKGCIAANCFSWWGRIWCIHWSTFFTCFTTSTFPPQCQALVNIGFKQ